jgi:hypothetical protein
VVKEVEMTQEEKYKKLKKAFKEFWEEEYGCVCCGSDDCEKKYRKAIWKFITKALQEREREVLEKVEVAIAKEMNIANKEGQPTSRLSSLAVKLKP